MSLAKINRPKSQFHFTFPLVLSYKVQHIQILQNSTDKKTGTGILSSCLSKLNMTPTKGFSNYCCHNNRETKSASLSFYFQDKDKKTEAGILYYKDLTSTNTHVTQMERVQPLNKDLLFIVGPTMGKTILSSLSHTMKENVKYVRGVYKAFYSLSDQSLTDVFPLFLLQIQIQM